jgi:hypothetical protein
MHKILIYLLIIHLLKSSICFEHYPAHLQEVYVVIVYMQHLVSSLSAGDCPVHRLRKNSSKLYQHVLLSDLGFQTRSTKVSNDWELLHPLTQISKRNRFLKSSVPKNENDIQNIRQIIAIYHQYLSDFANVLIRKGMTLRNFAVGWHETTKFISSSLSVPLTPTDSHLLDQVQFALLSRRAHEPVADIILRNFFTSIRPWRLCNLMARFLNIPLVVHSFIASRTTATACNITTKSMFIHLLVCLTTGPKPLPKRVLHIVRSRVSSFKWEYRLLSLRSFSSFVRFLPCLPDTSSPPCIFPSVTRCRKQFVRKKSLHVRKQFNIRSSSLHSEAVSVATPAWHLSELFCAVSR